MIGFLQSTIEAVNSSIKESRRRTKSASYFKARELNKPRNYYSKHCFDYYKCIFIHIPKTGGVSISKTLFGNYTDHADIDWYLEHYHGTTVKRYFKFAFVRNPWDRLHSAYFFLKKGGMYKVDAEFYEKHLSYLSSFEEFVMEWLNNKTVESFIHFVPQYKFITSIGDREKIVVDFIGRFEQLEEDFHQVCKILKFKNIQLLKENITHNGHKKYFQSYSKEMKDKVQELYQRDIELFKYSFNSQ
jgi:hypothetical protein